MYNTQLLEHNAYAFILVSNVNVLFKGCKVLWEFYQLSLGEFHV